MNQVGGVRPLDIYQFDDDVVINEVSKETACKPTDNVQAGCLGMTGPNFGTFAGEMQTMWKSKQFTVYGVCEASYSGFLNYAMYEMSLLMFGFQVNTCNRGYKLEVKKETPVVEEKKEANKRLQKVDRRSMLSALSSGKFNKKKAEKTRHE